jgi:protein scribble
MLVNKICVLQVGMRLLEVNGVSLLGASHQEAVNALRNSGNDINMVVCKGKRIVMLICY